MSNPRLACVIFLVLSTLLHGCGGDAPANAVNALPTETSRYPFNVTELPVYSARVIVTTDARTDEFFLARNGDSSRTDLHVGTSNHTSRIVAGSEIVVMYSTRTYYELPRGNGEIASLGESSPEIRALFTNSEPSRFERVGSENGQAKYRVRASGEQSGENFVFVDEKAGLVIRQEFWSAGSLVYSTEIRDLKLEASDALFQIPQGFRKVKAR